MTHNAVLVVVVTRAATKVVVYSSTRPSTLTSTRVLVNTRSTLIQAASDEEVVGGLVSQHRYCYWQHCAKRRRYLSSLEVDFEVFRPTGVTRCTDGGEIVN